MQRRRRGPVDGSRRIGACQCHYYRHPARCPLPGARRRRGGSWSCRRSCRRSCATAGRPAGSCQRPAERMRVGGRVRACVRCVRACCCSGRASWDPAGQASLAARCGVALCSCVAILCVVRWCSGAASDADAAPVVGPHRIHRLPSAWVAGPGLTKPELAPERA